MKKFIPHVTPKYLLLIAGIVWIIAGVNVVKIGLTDFILNWNGQGWYVLGSLLVFTIFMRFIFYPLVKKHHIRILKMEDKRVPFYKFFDVKSYIIMICMITGGILVRSAHILPSIAIGVLYCGIGFSLMGAGILFLTKFLITKDTVMKKGLKE